MVLKHKILFLKADKILLQQNTDQKQFEIYNFKVKHRLSFINLDNLLPTIFTLIGKEKKSKRYRASI